MDEAAALELARRAVALATRCGAESADATVSIARRFHVEARDLVISKLERATAGGLYVRVFVDGRKAQLATTDLSLDALETALRATIDRARYVARDPFAGLPQAFAPEIVALDLYDPAVAEKSDAAKIDDVLELERLVRTLDPRIVNSDGSSYADAIALTAIANSAGFAGAFTSTRAGIGVAPVAHDGTVKRTAHYGTAARRLSELEDLETVGRIAALRAVELFGARKPPTANLPVIFERDVASALLGDVLAAVSAANVSTGNSWLAGSAGETIGSPLVTIVDDGRLPGKLGSAPFDAEGVATGRTTVFESGRLRTFLYDSYYARKMDARSTGNASGGGIGPSNFYLEAGAGSLEETIAATARGVLVLGTIGFATEHASGNYSRGANGFFIEHGERAYPIDECTIAGNYADMLAGVDRVAGDLRFDASVVSPSFRIAEMTVSGN